MTEKAAPNSAARSSSASKRLEAASGVRPRVMRLRELRSIAAIGISTRSNGRSRLWSHGRNGRVAAAEAEVVREPEDEPAAKWSASGARFQRIEPEVAVAHAPRSGLRAPPTWHARRRGDRLRPRDTTGAARPRRRLPAAPRRAADGAGRRRPARARPPERREHEERRTRAQPSFGVDQLAEAPPGIGAAEPTAGARASSASCRRSPCRARQSAPLTPRRVQRQTTSTSCVNATANRAPSGRGAATPRRSRKRLRSRHQQVAAVRAGREAAVRIASATLLLDPRELEERKRDRIVRPNSVLDLAPTRPRRTERRRRTRAPSRRSSPAPSARRSTPPGVTRVGRARARSARR